MSIRYLESNQLTKYARWYMGRDQMHNAQYKRPQFRKKFLGKI